MKRILCNGVGDSRNNGCWVMLASCVEGIRAITPLPIHFTSLTAKTSDDHRRLHQLNLSLVIYPWTRLSIRKINILYRWACFFILPVIALGYRAAGAKSSIFPFWKAFLEADLVIDLSGDSISADYPPYSLVSIAMPLIIARILGKPYMLCAQSIGPFGDGIINKILVALIRDAALITTRERITDDILAGLHIHGNVVPAQDLAFSLEPAAHERIQEICKLENIDPDLEWTGFSISDLISVYAFKELPLDKRRGAYVDVMVAFSDWIVEQHGMHVLFVPHVIIPNIGNDLSITLEIHDRMQHRDKAVVLKGSYNGDELKGVIGLCRLFAGSRMHATLGALSQAIPTMTYVYNHKTMGINGKILQQEEYLIDIRRIGSGELLERSKETFTRLVENAASISGRLEDILPAIVKGSRENAWQAVNLLEIAGPLARMDNPKLCSGCGACVAACAAKALAMRYTPQGTLRPGLVKGCTSCGLCLKACPALGFDISQEEESLFGCRAQDPELGVLFQAYKGYALDHELRRRSSSGGVATAIMARLLETRMVDAVLAVVDDPGNPVQPVGAWITDANDLHRTIGSRYTPVAPLAALGDTPRGAKKIAVVGLPCHLWGLRKLEKHHLLKNKEVVVRLGLFCNRTPSGHAREMILHKNSLTPGEIDRISYRGNGWPGGLRIEAREGQVFYPQDEIWPLMASPFYFREHCFFCPDFLAHLADISLGDAWLPECAGDLEGWSICLARSAAGQQILAAYSDALHIEELETSRLKDVMTGNINDKSRLGALKQMLYADHAAVRAVPLAGVVGPSPRQRIRIRFEHVLSNIGESRAFQYACLDYPLNRFMKAVNRVIALLK